MISADFETVFEPRHTTHGFRYVRVEGHPGELTPDDLTGVVVHSDLRRTGWFTCSDERLNRLHEAAVWSFRDNACDIPTDCPTRERAGWTGDWQLFVPTAAFLFDIAGFGTKWLRDLAAEQWPNGVVANMAPSPPAESSAGPVAGLNGSAGWGDAAVIVPWEIYRAYGDARLLEEQWPSMEAWAAYVERAAASGRHPGRIERHPNERPHDRYLWDTGFHWGEWLVPGEDVSDFEGLREADRADTATAYFAHSSTLMAEIARVLGRDAEARRYQELAGRVREAWVSEFVRPDGPIQPATQANHVRALAFDLVPPQLREGVAQGLVKLIAAAGGHLGTGFLATPYLLPVLAESGHLDIAYQLLFAEEPPSWLHMIKRGATTIWESWDGVDDEGVPHDSLNHYAKGAVISFLHRYIAGFGLLDGHPAYRHFLIQPRPAGGLEWAEAEVDTPHGTARSAWRYVDDAFVLDVKIPPGTTAVAVLPDGSQTALGPGSHRLTHGRGSGCV